jgi:hypothetical protein
MALIKDRYSLGFDFIIISRLNKHSFIQNSHIETLKLTVKGLAIILIDVLVIVLIIICLNEEFFHTIFGSTTSLSTVNEIVSLNTESRSKMSKFILKFIFTI